MTIARLKKLTVVGPASSEADAMEALQDLGCMHLVPLAPPPEQPEDAKGREAKDAYTALRFLTVIPDQRRQVLRDSAFDIHAFVPEVMELRARLRETRDRRDFLAHRISEVRPWGDLIFPPKEELAGNHLWFYKLPLKERDALDSLEIPWQIVHRDHLHYYVVLISRDEPDTDLLPVPRTHTGALPVSELEAQLEEAEIEIEELQAERQGLTRFVTLMRQQMSQAETRAELEYGRQQVLRDESLFAVQGWVPGDREEEILSTADRLGLAALVEEPQRDETPPTLLEQPEDRESGVDLVMFYQVPNYRDWDPSIIVSVSFALFFAMILADAAYGLIIAAIIAAMWSKLGENGHLRSWRRLLCVVAAATVIYGVMIGSYMGYAPPEGSFLASLKVLSVDDFSTMMVLSVTIGVLHLVLANTVAALNRWGTNAAWASLGWCAVLFGGLVYWLAGGNDWSTLGIALLAGGFLGILVFSSDRKVDKPIDLFWRVIGGLQGLAGSMGAFGDVLSYMRLFALGLASASLALTFNDLASQVREAVPGMGLLLALLIFLIGHTLNFALAIMSGVVHGLRLNYIEFFKWGLTEEGTAFRPFARKEVQE
ncbi:V-type ATP synthase subunit I [Lutimaribacter marinistellae]|uniref:V-type ATP synthase subunit I n=1 Tax=Lutimaribacter marinistellae TaxID=1820329 RepID=A0ABV7TNL0_9RHOB